MKRLNTLLIGLSVIYGCQTLPESDTQQPRNPSSLSREDIARHIDSQLEQQTPFYWDGVSSDFLWNVVVQEDSTMVIGYQPADYTDIDSRIHEVDPGDSDWRFSLSTVKRSIQQTYDRLGADLDVEEEVLHAHETLPYFHLKVRHVEVIEQLRAHENVRYVEPATYQPLPGSMADGLRLESKLGCGNDPDNIPASEYVTVSPQAKVPWNFYNMNIPAAWSHSRGKNVTIAIIDTGTSPDQNKLNSRFDDWYGPRYRLKFGTYVSSWWPWAKPDGPNDRCGHGTQMAGAATAPRSSHGSSVGVAYESNLVGIRGTKDVVITSSREKNGVSDALVLAGKRSDVKIISMSIGTPFYSSQVADAVRYAYGKGKMIFAAAGTSTSLTRFVGVVFPASMNETLAVTGITDGGYNLCSNCHKGSKVDFVAVMQRQGKSSRVSLTLANSGNTPSSVGGSSVATAMTAGIAALAWSADPSQSRAQVLNRLQNASDFYPGRSSDYGWGLIDALQAVQ